MAFLDKALNSRIVERLEAAHGWTQVSMLDLNIGDTFRMFNPTESGRDVVTDEHGRTEWTTVGEPYVTDGVAGVEILPYSAPQESTEVLSQIDKVCQQLVSDTLERRYLSSLLDSYAAEVGGSQNSAVTSNYTTILVAFMKGQLAQALLVAELEHGANKIVEGEANG